MNVNKFSQRKEINCQKKSVKLLTPVIYQEFIFFKPYMKEAVVANVFMFELNLLQIFGPRNAMLFCPSFVLQSGIFNAIFDLVL